MSGTEFQFAAEFARKDRLVVGFEVNGERFDIVVPRDGRCIPLIVGGELEEMMDLFHAVMKKGSFERFEDLVYDFDDGLKMSQIQLLYHHTISLLTGGQPYWVAQTLVITAMEMRARFLGEVALTGARPMELPLHEFCDVVYAWLTKDADKDQREKFDAQLKKPPPGAEVELIASQPEWANAGNDFLAAMAARGSR